MRTAEIKRKTAETDVFLSLNLDGSGISEINTGVGFLDHMLTLFSRHGRFDININCKGDVDVDDHHSVIILPMDETLILCAVDISGRSYLNCKLDIPAEKVGTFDTELAEEFFTAFVRSFPVTLHIKQLEGKNSHHIIEGTFKALGRVLDRATSIDRRFANEVPSTKGVL